MLYLYILPKLSYIFPLSIINNVDETLSKTLLFRQNPEKFERVKNKAIKQLSLLEKLQYIEKDEDGLYQKTEKGEIASKIFGINEIFMTELLYNPKYLKDCTADELIAICGMFADTKDVNQKSKFYDELEYLNKRSELIKELACNVNLEELEAETTVIAPRFSTKLVPYIIKFANAPKERNEAINQWQETMKELRKKNIMPHEGDFLRILGRTNDLLRLVAELSPDSNIRYEARKAIDKFKKAPITDIFDYELNINKNEE